jgi:hypothetical protein
MVVDSIAFVKGEIGLRPTDSNVGVFFFIVGEIACFD